MPKPFAKFLLYAPEQRRMARSTSTGVIAMSDKPVRREFVVDSALHGCLVMLALVTVIMGAAWVLGA